MFPRLGRAGRTIGLGLSSLLLTLVCGCREAGPTPSVGFVVNAEGNSGCLFVGPNLVAPLVDALFGPGGAAGRVDGDLSDPNTRITLSPTGGLAADGRSATLFLACDDPSVRVVDLAAGTITTLVDEGAFAAFDARITALGGIAVFDADTLLVCELSTHTILAVDRATGALARFAGVPFPGGGFSDGAALGGALFDFAAGAGIAVDGDGRVLVADSGNHRIRLLSGGSVRTIAGTGLPGFTDGLGTIALLDTPVGITIGCNGVAVFTELGQRVRQIRPFRQGATVRYEVSTRVGTGIPLSVDGTAAPNGSASVHDPVSPVTLPSGDVVWVDRGSGTLRWLMGPVNLVGSPVAGLGVDGAHGAAVASDDSWILLDATQGAIVRVR